MHLSASTYHEDETGWWEARCECGWHKAPLFDLDTVVDALMQHARERALIEDTPAVPEEMLRAARRVWPL